MKKEYIVSQSKLIRIEMPTDDNDLIGKYYLMITGKHKECFYRIAGYKRFTHNSTILLYSALNGTFPYRFFKPDKLPLFFKPTTADTEILFNVWE